MWKGLNVLSKANFTVGNGYKFKTHDIIGGAFSWDRPVDRDLKDQYIFEIFYRLNLTPTIEISPDLQFVVKPAYMPGKDLGGYLSIRTRITI